MTAPRRAPRPSEILEYHEHMVEALRILGRRFEEVVGMLKQIYHYRHWLAHGRNFTNKSGVQAYPRSSKNVVEAFVEAVQQRTPDFPRR